MKTLIRISFLVACRVWIAVAWKAYRQHHQPPPVVELLPYDSTVPAWDGAYPVLAIVPRTSSSGQITFTGSIVMRKPTALHPAPANEFDVNLDSGMFVLRQTDLFVPDVMPLSLDRTYRAWDYHTRAFGAGTNHPYDICPTGTRFPYTYMDLNLEDGRQMYFPRISKGTGYADAVFRHGNTSSEFYGAQIAWNGDGWTLNFSDHRQIIFPEAYYAKSYAQGAAWEMRDGQGHSIHLKRDAARNLQELVSPSSHVIKFKYDGAARITEAEDDAGNTRTYTYNSTGHLESVSDGSRVLYRFEYTRLLKSPGYDPYLMTAIMDANWRMLLRNIFNARGEVVKQELAHSKAYKYNYSWNSKNQVVQTIVTLPGGQTRQFTFQDGVYMGK